MGRARPQCHPRRTGTARSRAPSERERTTRAGRGPCAHPHARRRRQQGHHDLLRPRTHPDRSQRTELFHLEPVEHRVAELPPLSDTRRSTRRASARRARPCTQSSTTSRPTAFASAALSTGRDILHVTGTTREIARAFDAPVETVRLSTGALDAHFTSNATLPSSLAHDVTAVAGLDSVVPESTNLDVDALERECGLGTDDVPRGGKLDGHDAQQHRRLHGATASGALWLQRSVGGGRHWRRADHRGVRARHLRRERRADVLQLLRARAIGHLRQRRRRTHQRGQRRQRAR